MRDNEFVAALGRALGFKAGVAGGTPTAQSLYSPGGLFAMPGVSQQVISAIQLPYESLAKRLASATSNYLNEREALLLGYTSGTGSEPDGLCDDLPVAGEITGCTTTFPFGRFGRSSKVHELSMLGGVDNRGIFADLQLVGGQNLAHPFIPTLAGGSAQTRDLLRNDYRLAVRELSMEMLRAFGRMIYNGNPANRTAGGGYVPFKGLDRLINTGYVDSDDPSIRCEPMDSDVRTFNANIATDPGQIVRVLTNMVRNIKKRAENSGLNPVQLVICMRWSAFMEITEYWPCAYATYRCSFAASASDAQLMVDVGSQEQMRKDMRDGRYLLIDNEKVAVQIDDFIAETEASGTYQSDIYIVPEVAGGIRVTFMEFFDFNGPGAAGEVIRERGLNWIKVTDGGRFLMWEKLHQNTCIQMSTLTRPRLKLRTPQLAGRLQAVKYTPLKHEDSPWPDEKNYRSGGTAFR